DHGDLRVVERGAVEELAPLRRQLAVGRQREPFQDRLLLVGQSRVVRLVRRDVLGGDLDIGGEGQDRQGRRRRRRRSRSRRLGRWRRRGPRLERARQLVEELSPGRGEL